MKSNTKNSRPTTCAKKKFWPIFYINIAKNEKYLVPICIYKQINLIFRRTNFCVDSVHCKTTKTKNSSPPTNDICSPTLCIGIAKSVEKCHPLLGKAQMYVTRVYFCSCWIVKVMSSAWGAFFTRGEGTDHLPRIAVSSHLNSKRA